MQLAVGQEMLCPKELLDLSSQELAVPNFCNLGFFAMFSPQAHVSDIFWPVHSSVSRIQHHKRQVNRRAQTRHFLEPLISRGGC